MDSFHLLGSHEKRMRDAEEALQQLDVLGASGDHPLHATVDLVRAVSQAAATTPKEQEAAMRAALQAVAQQGAALAAGGATALASLAINMIQRAQQSAQTREGKAPVVDVAEAALKSISTDASSDWVVFVDSLPGASGVRRLNLAAHPLSVGSLEEAAERVVGAVDPNDEATAALVRHSISELAERARSEGHPSASNLALLEQWSAHAPADPERFTTGLVEGMRVAMKPGTSSSKVARATLERVRDGSDAAVVGKAAIEALPASGWGAWGRIVLAGLGDPAGQASLARAIVTAEASGNPCNAESVLTIARDLRGGVESGKVPRAVARPLVDGLLSAMSGGPGAATLAEVQALAARVGLDNFGTLTAMVGSLEQDDPSEEAGAAPGTPSPGLADLGRLGSCLSLDKEELEVARRAAGGLLKEAAAVSAASSDVEAAHGVAILQAAVDATKGWKCRGELFSTVAGNIGALPRDARGAAELAHRLASLMPFPQAGLDMLAKALPEIQALATDPTEVEMLGVMRGAVEMEPYEAETVLRGVTNALQWVSQPEPVKGSALAALIRTAEGGMNYWVDQAMVIQVGHDALAREAARLGDTGLAECVRFMQAVDARVDLSTEKERVKVQDRALEWLREIPTTGRTPASCVSAMALDMRNVTEAQVRDVWAGEAAAQVLEDLATRNHQLELKHESRFLRLLATRHAEYMEQRVEALYKAFEVQARDDLGPNARLATMATAAMGQLKPEQDQVLVARSALESMQALAVERGNESLAGQVGQWLALARARVVGEEERGALHRALMDSLAGGADFSPGALAGAGRALVRGLKDYNVRSVLPALLAGIEESAALAGETVYVPDLVKGMRRDLEAEGDTTRWAERLDRGLQELAHFQGEGLAHAVAASRTTSREGTSAPQIEAAADTVVIGGIRVPVRGKG